ncbi:MAG: septum formation family protein [Micrococcaceae bacterium]
MTIKDDRQLERRRHKVNPNFYAETSKKTEEKTEVKAEIKKPKFTIPILSSSALADKESLKLLEDQAKQQKKINKINKTEQLNRAARAAKLKMPKVEKADLGVDGENTDEIPAVTDKDPGKTGENAKGAPQKNSTGRNNTKRPKLKISKRLLEFIAVVTTVVLALGAFIISRDYIKASRPVFTPTATATQIQQSQNNSPQTIGVSSLQVGQCINNWKDADDNNQNYSVVPCTQSHNAEVFYVDDSLDLGDSGYPGNDTANAAVQQVCAAQVDSAINPDVDINGQGIETYWTHPDETSYNNGDRRAVCFFVPPQPVTTQFTK